jgi:hypothetical protein
MGNSLGVVNNIGVYKQLENFKGGNAQNSRGKRDVHNNKRRG